MIVLRERTIEAGPQVVEHLATPNPPVWYQQNRRATVNVTREEWRPIAERDGYEVSNKGRVRSLDRVVVFPDGRSRKAKGQILRPQMRSGYRVVFFGRKTVYVHDLVLEAFVGPKPPEGDVRHGQLGPLDNSLENLCYGTRSDNIYDCIADGNHPQASKTRCPEGHCYDGVGRRRSGTYRYCKRCKNAANRRHYARMRGVAA